MSFMISGYLQSLLQKELERQQNSLELIASENYVSKQVMQAYANVFTNKYSEWYPGKRYYGGNEVVDELELYTQQLALDIFGLDKQERWVNVQPLSGSVANLAVYTGLLNPGDTILAMSLDAWWHLTHGYRLNASGKYFNFVHYGVDKDGYIDYGKLKALAIEHKPKLILAGFSSYPRTIDREQFKIIKTMLASKHKHQTYLMADIAHIAWLIAWEVLQSPFQAGFDIITTTTHKTLRWPRGALVYYSKTKGEELGKQVNKWVFPGIQWWPFDHVLVAKAKAFEEILDPQTKWKDYCLNVINNAQTLASELSKLWRALVTWWTDNHLIVLDVTHKTIDGERTATGYTGKLAEKKMEEAGLSVSKQLLPSDPGPALNPSGIRIGTPAITTRWLQQADMITLAHIIDTLLTDQINLTNMPDKQIVRDQVLQLCQTYPLSY